MKKILRVSLIGVATILTMSVLSFLPKARTEAAGTASLTLSPSSGSHKGGDTITLTVTENSGSTAMNTVEADLSFDASKLQFVSASGAGTSFSNLSATGTSSTAKIVSYTSPVSLGGPGSLTGSHAIGTVTLKVKTVSASNSTSVTFADSSGIASAADSSDIWDHSPTGATFSLTAPASGGGTTNNTKTTTTKKTTTTTTGTKVSTTTAATQKANPAAPVAASVITSSSSNYLVTVKVVDTKDRVVSGASVTLDGKTSKTDSTGLAGFSNIPAGNYTVSVKSGKVQGKATINVSSDQPTNVAQQFEVKTKPRLNVALYGGIAAAVVVLIIVLVLWRGGMAGKLPKLGNHNLDAASGPAPTVVSTSGSGGNMITPAPTPPPAAPAPDNNLVKPTVITPAPTAVTPTASNPVVKV